MTDATFINVVYPPRGSGTSCEQLLKDKSLDTATDSFYPY